MFIYGFKNLKVWQKAFSLSKLVYKLTKNFPENEKYGLISQMNKAGISIVSNIAEGYGRPYKKEFNHFLSIAYGSLCELETQYLLALEFGYIENQSEVESLMNEVGRMLYRMINPQRS